MVPMFSLSYSFFCLSICFALWNTTCEKSSDVSATMCDVMFSENTIVDKKACSIQMRCVHTEVRLCVVQLSCGCLWTNGKKTTNKEGTMLVYNVYAMHILSRVENWEYLHPCSTTDAC